MPEKSRKSLAYKRSFFVRMVSDPKIYNPKIVTNKSFDTNDSSLEVQSPKVLLDNQNINIAGVKVHDDVPPSPTQ